MSRRSPFRAPISPISQRSPVSRRSPILRISPRSAVSRVSPVSRRSPRRLSLSRQTHAVIPSFEEYEFQEFDHPQPTFSFSDSGAAYHASPARSDSLLANPFAYRPYSPLQDDIIPPIPMLRRSQAIDTTFDNLQLVDRQAFVPQPRAARLATTPVSRVAGRMRSQSRSRSRSPRRSPNQRTPARRSPNRAQRSPRGRSPTRRSPNRTQRPSSRGRNIFPAERLQFE